MKSRQSFSVGMSICLIFAFTVFSSPQIDKNYSTLIGTLAGDQNYAEGGTFLKNFHMNDLRHGEQITERSILSPIRLTGNLVRDVIDLINAKFVHYDCEARATWQQVDELHYTHMKFQQYYKGIEIVGAEFVVHCDEQNIISSVNGKIMDNNYLHIDPAISLQAGCQRAVSEVLAISPNQTAFAEKNGTLVIFEGALAYRIYVSYTDQIPVRWECFVDATSGELLFGANTIIPLIPFSSAPLNEAAYSLKNRPEPAVIDNTAQTSSGVAIKGNRLAREGGAVVTFQGSQQSSSYTLRNTTEKWAIYDNNTSQLISGSSADFGSRDPEAMSAAFNTSLISKAIQEVTGWNSWDNQGGTIGVYIKLQDANAFSDGTKITIGNGKGASTQCDPLDNLDVIAHECGHHMTSRSSGLGGTNEPGSLNESYADIQATVFELLKQEDGTSTYPHTVGGKSDYVIAEDCWMFKESGEADDLRRMRDLRDPWRGHKTAKTNNLPHPKYYKGQYWFTGTGDQGGVHVNNGPQNYAFYLLAAGPGIVVDEKQKTHYVKGIGFMKAGQLALKADYSSYINGSANYKSSRDAWIKVAKELKYGLAEVTAAWAAVGLPGGAKSIALSTTTLDFGEAPVTKPKKATLKISNPTGVDPTVVYEIKSDNPVFSYTGTLPLAVEGGSSIDVELTYTPTKEGTDQGKCTIKNNSDKDTVLTVTLSGKGIPDNTDITNKNNQTAQSVGFSANPNPVTITSGEAVTLRCTNKEYRIAKIVITDALGSVVLKRTYAASSNRTAFSDTWNCRSKGKRIGSGAYQVKVFAYDKMNAPVVLHSVLGIKE
ncbi:MAG: M4 family metallopeptidase [Chitinivibrionales bacterium]|nr:M4 family metallopeptidase [Chitinivibrionales bacterium]